MAAKKQARMLAAGDRAPEVKLKQLGGEARSLQDLLARGPVLLAFYKTTCPVCQLAFPFLERIHRGQSTAAFSIYGISQDDDADTRDFNREFGVSFPTLLDSEDAGYPASNAYGISHVPSVFLVEPGGAISRAFDGFDKQALAALGARAGVATFRPGDRVPDFKPG